MGNLLSLKKAVLRKNRLCIWVLGGPCSGRSTQCKLLAKQFQLAHISAEAIIRDCINQEHIKKPEARLQRLRRKRMYTYNAIKTHEKMTQDEKAFLGTHHETFIHSKYSSVSHRHLFLLRPDSESEDGDYRIRDVQNSLRKGQPINPESLTLLIKEAMQSVRMRCNGFLIDGYPRDAAQALQFIQRIGRPHIILYLESPNDVLKERVMKRARLAQRFDDNEFTISFKFESFAEKSLPLINHWLKKLSAKPINGNQEISEVTEACIAVIEKKAGSFKFKIFKEIKKLKDETLVGMAYIQPAKLALLKHLKTY